MCLWFLSEGTTMIYGYSTCKYFVASSTTTSIMNPNTKSLCIQLLEIKHSDKILFRFRKIWYSALGWENWSTYTKMLSREREKGWEGLNDQSLTLFWCLTQPHLGQVGQTFSALSVAVHSSKFFQCHVMASCTAVGWRWARPLEQIHKNQATILRNE